MSETCLVVALVFLTNGGIIADTSLHLKANHKC